MLDGRLVDVGEVNIRILHFRVLDRQLVRIQLVDAGRRGGQVADLCFAGLQIADLCLCDLGILRVQLTDDRQLRRIAFYRLGQRAADALSAAVTFALSAGAQRHLQTAVIFQRLRHDGQNNALTAAFDRHQVARLQPQVAQRGQLSRPVGKAADALIELIQQRLRHKRIADAHTGGTLSAGERGDSVLLGGDAVGISGGLTGSDRAGQLGEHPVLPRQRRAAGVDALPVQRHAAVGKPLHPQGTCAVDTGTAPQQGGHISRHLPEGGAGLHAAHRCIQPVREHQLQSRSLCHVVQHCPGGRRIGDSGIVPLLHGGIHGVVAGEGHDAVCRRSTGDGVDTDGDLPTAAAEKELHPLIEELLVRHYAGRQLGRRSCPQGQPVRGAIDGGRHGDALNSVPAQLPAFPDQPGIIPPGRGLELV